MKIGIIGLGKMGSAIAERFINAGHTVYGFDGNKEVCAAARIAGVEIVTDTAELVRSSQVVWLMLPAGEVIDEVIQDILTYLRPHHIVVDGGNSHPHDSARRHDALKQHQIHFVDCGTSGGVHGKVLGFSLMIGGDREAFQKLEPLFKALAAPQGYAYVGPAGAGHYVKMVHNGIEYALLQSYAEGFNLLRHGEYEKLDLERISRVWMNGSIIRSWILNLSHNVLKHDQDLEEVSGAIGENKTGAWTLEEAKRRNVPVDLIEKSLEIRAWSRKTGGNYATKLVAMLRKEFGGHPLGEKEKK